MGTINMVKTIKMIYPNCVVFVKIGNFYHVVGLKLDDIAKYTTGWLNATTKEINKRA